LQIILEHMLQAADETGARERIYAEHH
jgi:hypothetical protein